MRKAMVVLRFGRELPSGARCALVSLELTCESLNLGEFRHDVNPLRPCEMGFREAPSRAA